MGVEIRTEQKLVSAWPDVSRSAETEFDRQAKGVEMSITRVTRGAVSHPSRHADVVSYDARDF